MLDFTSSLYLGLRHGSASLLPWPSLTSGRPAALGELPASADVAASLAALQGCETATLGPSTLHLFWDLFSGFDPGRTVICLDRGTYPVARWGVERAAAQGTPVRAFGHHNPDELRRALNAPGTRGLSPIIVADGFCPTCGKAAPLASYLDMARERGGRLVIDDTQALGILGAGPNSAMPYGFGGGGSLRHAGITGTAIIVVSSLAKAFGAPVAAIAGSRHEIAAFVARADTRVHCSPPSAAVLHAAARALALNVRVGEQLRHELCQLVRRFRMLLAAAGFSASGGLFPVQTIVPIGGMNANAMHHALRRRGIAAILQQDHRGTGSRVSFIITTRHRRMHLERVMEALASAVSVGSRSRQHLGVNYERAMERALVIA